MADNYRINVLEKASSILELFNEDVSELSASEVQGLLLFNKTTTFRLLNNLERLGYLDRDPDTQRYRLGLRLAYLGSLVKPYATLRQVAKPFMVQLNKDTRETVHLAILHKGQSLYLEKVEGNRTIRVSTSQGSMLPAHCSGVGKILLSGLNLEEVAQIAAQRGLTKFTDNTIDNLDQLAEELRTAREQGLAIDHEEIEEGLMCAAAPVISGGRIVAAVSLSVPKERFMAQWDSLTTKIKKTAADISQSMDERESVTSFSNQTAARHRQNEKALT